LIEAGGPGMVQTPEKRESEEAVASAIIHAAVAKVRYQQGIYKLSLTPIAID